jgi:hypothetical protein
MSLTCPNCSNLCKISEHEFFHYNVIAVKCDFCRLFTIVNGDRWIQYPTHPCMKCLVGSPHRCEQANPEAVDEAFWLAQYRAQTEWSAMAKEVHERNLAGAPRVDPYAGCSRCGVCGEALANFAVDHRVCFEQGSTGIVVDPPKPPQSWRDRPPAWMP